MPEKDRKIEPMPNQQTQMLIDWAKNNGFNTFNLIKGYLEIDPSMLDYLASTNDDIKSQFENAQLNPKNFEEPRLNLIKVLTQDYFVKNVGLRDLENIFKKPAKDIKQMIMLGLYLLNWDYNRVLAGPEIEYSQLTLKSPFHSEEYRARVTAANIERSALKRKGLPTVAR